MQFVSPREWKVVKFVPQLRIIVTTMFSSLPSIGFPIRHASCHTLRLDLLREPEVHLGIAAPPFLHIWSAWSADIRRKRPTVCCQRVLLNRNHPHNTMRWSKMSRYLRVQPANPSSLCRCGHLLSNDDMCCDMKVFRRPCRSNADTFQGLLSSRA